MAHQMKNLCGFSVFHCAEGAFGASSGGTPKMKNGAPRDELKNGRYFLLHSNPYGKPHQESHWTIILGRSVCKELFVGLGPLPLAFFITTMGKIPGGMRRTLRSTRSCGHEEGRRNKRKKRRRRRSMHRRERRLRARGRDDIREPNAGEMAQTKRIRRQKGTLTLRNQKNQENQPS